MNVLFQDIRYGIRMLAKSPGSTALAVITLTLGIGVNTALYSVMDAMRRIPHRFSEADELALLWRINEENPGFERLVDATGYMDWREQSESFADMALLAQSRHILIDEGEPERVTAVDAATNLIPMLGLGAQVGRLHTVGDGAVGAERTVILTDRFWERRFNRDLDVIGKTVTLDDNPCTIVGVLPPEADFEQLLYTKFDVLLPLQLDAAELKRGSGFYYSVARLSPNVTLDQAQAELSGIAARLAGAYPETNAKIGARVQPLTERYFSTEDRLASYALLGAVGCVLLIACVNLANLALAKGTVRGREFAVRLAMGAGRGRIVRQLLTESLLLAVVGGGLGLFVGLWIVDYLVVRQADYFPFGEAELGLHPAVLAYTVALSCVAAVIFGLAPALAASKVALSEAMKEGSASASAGISRNRLRSTLVVGQLAITLPLIICAGLVIRHIVALKTVDVGFNTERLLVMQVDLPGYRYDTDAARATYFHDAVAAAAVTPGVETASAVNLVPLGFGRSAVNIAIEGRVPAEGGRRDSAGFNVITPDFFDTMEIPLITGRTFSDHDHADAPRVAIVNQKMAAHYWPNDDAVGKRIKLNARGAADEWTTVVGVVGDIGHAGLWHPREPALYVPHRQDSQHQMVLLARTATDPTSLMQALRGAIRQVDPDQPIYGVRTMEDVLQRWLRDDRSAVWFLSGLAGLALTLASIGLYGVMSFSVAQRTHEIGVRAALGAGKPAILHLVIGRCLRMAAIGVAVGLLLSVGVGLALEAHLYGVSGIDPVTFAGVAVLLLAVAAAAGYLPARRATRVDPMVALRYE